MGDFAWYGIEAEDEDKGEDDEDEGQRNIYPPRKEVLTD